MSKIETKKFFKTHAEIVKQVMGKQKVTPEHIEIVSLVRKVLLDINQNYDENRYPGLVKCAHAKDGTLWKTVLVSAVVRLVLLKDLQSKENLTHLPLELSAKTMRFVLTSASTVHAPFRCKDTTLATVKLSGKTQHAVPRGCQLRVRSACLIIRGEQRLEENC